MFINLQKIINNNYFFSICLLFLAWFVISDNFAKMTGSIFPITSNLIVESVEPYEVSATKITGRTTKHFNCNFTGMKWMLNENGVKVGVPSYFLDVPTGNPAGEIEFTGIVVGVSPDRLSLMSSTVSHKCTLGMKIITEFYSGDDLNG